MRPLPRAVTRISCRAVPRAQAPGSGNRHIRALGQGGARRLSAHRGMSVLSAEALPVGVQAGQVPVEMGTVVHVSATPVATPVAPAPMQMAPGGHTGGPSGLVFEMEYYPPDESCANPIAKYRWRQDFQPLHAYGVSRADWDRILDEIEAFQRKSLFNR